MQQPDNITPAIDRLFRSYVDYTQAASEDTLFPLLTALHSLDDRVEAIHDRQFFDIPEYVALKALRNHFHHGGEVKYALKVKALGRVGLNSDLLHVCLVSDKDCAAAIKGAGKKYQEKTMHAFAQTTRVYGSVVDINPCIFNAVVKIYEKLDSLGYSGVGEAFDLFENQYAWETRNGHSHYVSGSIQTHAANVGMIPALMEGLYASA